MSKRVAMARHPLELGETPLDQVAVFVGDRVEGERTTFLAAFALAVGDLVFAFGDDRLDAAPSQVQAETTSSPVRTCSEPPRLTEHAANVARLVSCLTPEERQALDRSLRSLLHAID
ncbi:hypothetical protein SAMN05216276_100970 [Streptosporangium subroseum]|uniref:Uncharacterized protein n=1 Tax=Streptosporangium subroseum TaxID=106412 RepID=A0A239EE63_9ACTN|nr:hypothetical protein [Streptosporangium subroseum]SNS42194.1 hypothetical protein SAMN05216276_100970 [Streptosporangium subroseum]